MSSSISFASSCIRAIDFSNTSSVMFSRHDHHAIVVSQDKIARVDQIFAAHHRMVDQAQAALDRASDGQPTRKHREAAGDDVFGIAHTIIDDQAGDAIGLARIRS